MFKVPSNVLQDLQLIHELVQAEAEPRKERLRACSIASSTASTNATTDSEEEDAVENLLENESNEVKPAPASPSADSDVSSSSDSESESDSESDGGEIDIDHTNLLLDDIDDEDEGGNKQAAGVALRTKNEVPEPSIVVPDFQEVDANEPLERVGEVMSIVDNVVIVKGIPSAIENVAAERALDSDSLLVFEDRKVLGYIHETFGPTHLPLYQVKFLNSASLDRSIVQISRTVYHVPTRSKFVFPRQLAKMKGSDASNVHDEEVGEDEVEFSDDEAEAAFKRQRNRERESRRSSSVASSRHSTPAPPHARSQEVSGEPFYSASPYDDYSPYETDPVAGPSRPTPLPYDDPYADWPSTTHDMIETTTEHDSKTESDGKGGDNVRSRDRPIRGRGRGRGERRAGRNGRDNDRRGRGRGWQDRQRRGGFSTGNFREADERSSRPLSPTSFAIARATGQPSSSSQSVGDPYDPQFPSGQQQMWQQSAYDLGSGNYPAPPLQNFHNQPYVQPHINPRFASQFGLNMNLLQQQAPQGYQYSGENWNTTWLHNTGYTAPEFQRGGPSPNGAADTNFSHYDQTHS